MYTPLKNDSFAPLTVHVGEDVSFAAKSQDDAGLAGLMLMDADDQLIYDYQRPGEAEVLFPLAYLIDADGIIQNIYVNAEPELEVLLEIIQSLLP